MFNSMESQKAMLIFYKIDANSIDVLLSSLSYVSNFLTFVIAFLMVYANQFLIKRRKKELGLYMTLGMGRMKISLILFLETLLTGVVSLVVGLAIGFIGSHFLSIITAKMFLVNLEEFRFMFSLEATIKSVIGFSVLFLIIMILNTFNMAKVNLIDLLNDKKNQKQKIKNKYLAVVLFVLSLCSLFYAYYCITVNGMLSINNVFAQSIIFGIIGSFLFFMSLGSIILELSKKNKKLYYYQLNMFSIRQIYSKVNTTFVLMAIISIMLLIAIGTFATGNGAAMAINQALDIKQPFDVTLIQYEDVTIDYNDLPGQHVSYDYYATDFTYGSISDQIVNVASQNIKDVDVCAIKLSEMNELLEFMDRPKLTLESTEMIIVYNSNDLDDLYLDAIGSTIISNQKNITIVDTVFLKYENERNPMNIGTAVLSDEMFDEYYKYYNVINSNTLDEETYKKYINENAKSYSITVKSDIISQSLSLSILVTYISIYVGIVFIMASVVILSLQQLSEASENAKRYELLRKLGVEESQIKHSILVQISTYFLLPLLLAIAHSAVGINVSSNVVRIFGNLDVTKNVLVTSSFVLAIYGSYFIVTYISIKSMVLNNK
jgi:putative ABC transport system permease protein